MNYQTNEQLSEMKLHAMKLEYKRQQELPAKQIVVKNKPKLIEF